MQIRVWQREHDFIVYDGERIDDPSPSLFDVAWWQEQGLTGDRFSGRGAVHVVRHDDQRWVLRQYRRGGLVGRVVDHSYVWTGLAQTRPWREWHLLAELHGAGLPVPRPVAAYVSRNGMRYSGHILSELIEGVTPLLELLRREKLGTAAWSRLGRTMRHFHRAHVHHPDLNISNVLVQDDGRYFLVDFDRGRLHAGTAVLQADIRRLRRSLDKHRAKTAPIHFEEADWRAFIEGYSSQGLVPPP